MLLEIVILHSFFCNLMYMCNVNLEERIKKKKEKKASSKTDALSFITVVPFYFHFLHRIVASFGFCFILKLHL